MNLKQSFETTISSPEARKYKIRETALQFVGGAEYQPNALLGKLYGRYFTNTNVLELNPKVAALRDKDFTDKSFTHISEAYGIDQSDLHAAYKELEKMAIEAGIDLEYQDLTGFSEDEFYGNDVDEEEKHAETARSDGKKLIMEQNLEMAEGIEGRLYDLMHVGFGHMVQWSCDDDNLLLDSEKAWAIGYRNHDESPDEVLEVVKMYEFEGGILGIQKLKEALTKTNIGEEDQEMIVQYFTDLATADREFIMSHYRGNHDPLSSFWNVGNLIPDTFQFPETAFIQRESVELGVIRELTNK